jgi:hypothetical protein
MTSVPLTPPKRPFVDETIMCLTENSTVVCPGSIAQVVAVDAAGLVTTVVLTSVSIVSSLPRLAAFQA